MKPFNIPLTIPVVFCLLATWLIWGSTYLGIRFALDGFPPYWQMASRFAIAGVLLYGFLRVRGVAKPTIIEWRNAFIVGGLMLGGGMGCIAVAEETVSSGLVATLIAALPMISAFWNYVLNRVLPNKLEIIAILLGLAGVVWLMSGQGLGGSPKGTALVFTAMVLWGLGSMLSRGRTPLAAGANGTMGFASEMLAGSVVLTLLALITQEPLPAWHAISTKAWLAWVYLIIAGSLLAFSAYMYLLRTVSASLATSYALVNPIVALLLGVWLGGEVIAANEIGAIVVILAAVTMMFWGQRGR